MRGDEMDIKIFDLKEDKKVSAKCLLIDIKISEYIDLIEENLEDLDIQRGKILSRKRDIYKRLIEDLKEGTIMPPISLILKEKSTVYDKIKDKTDLKEIERTINEEIKKGDFSILDGIQRTYCILNVRDDIEDSERKESFLNTRLRAEIWYDITTTALLYKMLVLNTGQVKMSMKHQIEILNISLRDKILKIGLNNGVSLKFSTFKSPVQTNEVYHYNFSDIVEAFTSFITKSPIVDKTNVVVQELERMKFIEEHSAPERLLKEEEIEEFVNVLITIDKSLWNKYQKPLTEENIDLPWTSRKEIIGSAPILSGIFAVFGKEFSENKIGYNQRKMKFIEILQRDEDDPLKLRIMSRILEDEKRRTPKFGETIRKFFSAAFRAFFKGEDNFDQIWQRAIE